MKDKQQPPICEGLFDDIEKFGHLLADLAKSIGYKFENPDLERMKEIPNNLL